MDIQPVKYCIETKRGEIRYLCYFHMLAWPVDDMRIPRIYCDNSKVCYTCNELVRMSQ